MTVVTLRGSCALFGILRVFINDMKTQVLLQVHLFDGSHVRFQNQRLKTKLPREKLNKLFKNCELKYRIK